MGISKKELVEAERLAYEEIKEQGKVIWSAPYISSLTCPISGL
jgi:hypothetical protein